jgi:regulator of replication initiation timing
MLGGVNDIPSWMAGVGILLTTAAVVAGGWAVSRTAAIKATLETVILGNDELRKTNDDLRQELAQERANRAADHAEHKAKMARLEGQMQMLTGHLGEQIATAVTAAISRNSQSRDRSTDHQTTTVTTTT